MADIKFTAAYCYCSVFALRQVIKKVSLKDRFIKLGRREQKKKKKSSKSEFSLVKDIVDVHCLLHSPQRNI